MQGVRWGYVKICKDHQNGCWGCLYAVGCNWQAFQVGKKILRV